MINYEKFKEIKEMQVMGKSQSEISKKIEIRWREIERYWKKTEADYFRMEAHRKIKDYN